MNEIIDDKDMFKPVETDEEKKEKPTFKLSSQERKRVYSLKRLTYGEALSQDDILFIKQKRTQKHRIFLPYAYCEKCGIITKDLFEMPLSSNNPNSNYASFWHCNDCKDKEYYNTGKGAIINEITRRETLRIKNKTERVEIPQV